MKPDQLLCCMFLLAFSALIINIINHGYFTRVTSSTFIYELGESKVKPASSFFTGDEFSTLFQQDVLCY